MLKIIELIFSKHEYEIGDNNYKRFLNKKFLKRVDNVFYSLYYDNEFKKLIYEFKYRRLKYIAKFIASLINKDINFIIKKYNIDNIIAVPLNINRLRQRGFNQTELILEELGISNTKVKRVENTIKMSKIKENYLKVLNVQKAFDVNNLNLDNKKILIFDDLITSGATTMRLQKEIQKVYKNTHIYIYAIAISKKYEKELADAKIIQCFEKK